MCRVFRPELGDGNCITDAGGVADISRWCKPPVTTTKCGEPRQGRRNGRPTISAAPAGARIQSSRRTRRGGLISNVPSGQVAVCPALTLDMQCVLISLRSKSSLKHVQHQGWKGSPVIAESTGWARKKLHLEPTSIR